MTHLLMQSAVLSFMMLPNTCMPLWINNCQQSEKHFQYFPGFYRTGNQELHIAYPFRGKSLKAFIQSKQQGPIWPSCLNFKICQVQLGQFAFHDSDQDKSRKLCNLQQDLTLKTLKNELKLWCNGKLECGR